MKTSVALFFLIPICTFGQGTMYVYDQQSSSNEAPWPYGSGSTLQQIPPPYGQSFTPALTSVDFIRLNLNDGNVNDGLGATMYINLRSGSLTGAIIGTTAPVTMASFFTGPATFLFPSSIPLVAGDTYYFEPVVQSGGAWNMADGESNYTGGSAYRNGLPQPMSDFWFREGVIVPEPSSVALLFIGAAVFWGINARRKRNSGVLTGK
jgi:hypothetical protein